MALSRSVGGGPEARPWLSRLPKGKGLPDPEFRRRHGTLTLLLWVSMAALLGYSLTQGYGVSHIAAHVVPMTLLAALASAPFVGKRARAGCSALGLSTAAAVLVHLTRGLTEAHFAFFVLIVLLALYEDWLPFLVTLAFVVIHHGLLGTIDPHAVFSGPSLEGSAWKWAALHSGFVLAAGLAAIAVWGHNDRLREEAECLIARLSALSQQDQLTGLPNRRAWDERFGVEIDRARRSGEPLSVCMLDIDNLKKVNDDLGHEAGDRLLHTAASCWTQALRTTDYLCRLGGDEFAVLMPECSTSEGIAVAQRLVAAMPGNRGVSVGVASWDGTESPQCLLKRADAVLYEAKRSGRSTARWAPSPGVVGQPIAS